MTTDVCVDYTLSSYISKRSMDKRRDIAKRAVVSEKKVICSSYWMKFETEIIFGIKDFRKKLH